MQALVLAEDKRLEFTDISPPAKMGAESVLVRVAYAGLCGSDLPRAFEGKAYHYPLIMGHEISGVVERSFKGSLYSPGDRVVVFPLLPCRRCAACQTGDFAQCEDYDYFGSRRDGGFAELLEVPEGSLLPIPDHLELLHAAMAEPCAVALHGVSKLRVRPGDTAVVFGGGPVGNMVAQWLRIRGCGQVFVVEIDRRKCSLAEEMGFSAINPEAGDPVAALRMATQRGGADCVVEACGLPLTFLQAIRSAGDFGQVLFLGNIRGRFIMEEGDFSSVLRRELTIIGTWNSRFVPRGQDDWSVALRHMGRSLRVAPLISHVIELREGKTALKDIWKRRFGYYSKIVFKVA